MVPSDDDNDIMMIVMMVMRMEMVILIDYEMLIAIIIKPLQY